MYTYFNCFQNVGLEYNLEINFAITIRTLDHISDRCVTIT